jgi:hypothetical protein
VKTLQCYIEQPDLLVDTSLSPNVSSDNVDIYIFIASRFGSNGGWVALGAGHAMAGSLVFIMYLEKTRNLSFPLNGFRSYSYL